MYTPHKTTYMTPKYHMHDPLLPNTYPQIPNKQSLKIDLDLDEGEQWQF